MMKIYGGGVMHIEFQFLILLSSMEVSGCQSSGSGLLPVEKTCTLGQIEHTRVWEGIAVTG